MALLQTRSDFVCTLKCQLATFLLLLAAGLCPGGVALGRSSLPDVDAVMPAVQQAFQFLHENPEVGLKEFRAHDYVLAALQPLHAFTFETVARLPTAVIAVLDTGRAGPTLALRAELDARPLDSGVVEPSSHSPHSRIDGFMHNCGHDAHAAMLLGAATYAAAHKNRLRGKLVFIFQPAEEVKGGADDIVADGLLPRLGVQALFAQHSSPGLPVGTITLSPGTPLAGSWYYTLTLAGHASHAATPYEGSDTAVAAARLIPELVTFPAHGLDIANNPVVIGVSRMTSTTPTLNALPTQAIVEGTIRAFEDIELDKPDAPGVVSKLKERISRLADVYKLTATLEVHPGSPPTTNSDRLFGPVVEQLRATWKNNLQTPLYRGMFSEDFAYYTAATPSLYFGLGIAKDGLGTGAIHSADFTIHPDALRVGTRLLVDLMSINPGR